MVQAPDLFVWINERVNMSLDDLKEKKIKGCRLSPLKLRLHEQTNKTKIIFLSTSLLCP